MGWTTIWSGKPAYEYTNDYSRTNGNATLNFQNSFSIGWTCKTKLNTGSYSIWYKGAGNVDPTLTNVNNTLFIWKDNAGFLRVQLFINNNGSNCIYAITNDPIMIDNNPMSIEVVWDKDNRILNIYKNGISVDHYYVQSGNYNSPLNFSNIILNNSNTTPLDFGKAFGFNQCEDIVSNAYVYQKVRTALEVYNTYLQNQPPVNNSVLHKIFFSTTRNTNPQRSRLYTMTDKGENQIIFIDNSNDNYDIKVLYSNNPSFHGTKLTWTRSGTGIIVSDINGNNPVVAVSNNSNQIYGSTFNYQGTKLFYNKMNASANKYSIYSADFNFTNNTVSNESLVIGDNSGDLSEPDISPDGISMLGVKKYNNNTWELYKCNASNGLNYVSLTSGTSGEVISNPRFNRQGTKIAFSKRTFHYYSNSYIYQIFIMDVNGGNLKQITGSYFESLFNSWSPDGNFIVGYLKGTNTDHAMFKITKDGKAFTNLSGTYNQGYQDYYLDWFLPNS